MTASLLTVALEAARLAGIEIVRQRSSTDLKIGNKSSTRDLVTTADTAAEEIILREIRKHFPDHAVLAEESAPGLSNREALHGPLWVVDPIDGTMNYAHGHPYVGVSIAFYDGGQGQVAVVDAPFMQETFTAERGKGAYLNGKRISVSSCETLENSLIATGFPAFREINDEPTRRVAALIPRIRDIRRLGAASLDVCWVACGRLDAYYETINAWDIAAATLIAREAGARIGNLVEPDPTAPLPRELFATWYLATTPKLYDPLSVVLRSA